MTEDTGYKLPPNSCELPKRRHSMTERILYKGSTWLLGLGFDDDGRVRELFLKGPKVGSDLEAIINQETILVSHLLQRADLTPRQVLGMVMVDLDGETGMNAATLLHCVLNRAAEIDEEMRKEVA